MAALIALTAAAVLASAAALLLKEPVKRDIRPDCRDWSTFDIAA